MVLPTLLEDGYSHHVAFNVRICPPKKIYKSFNISELTQPVFKQELCLKFGQNLWGGLKTEFCGHDKCRSLRKSKILLAVKNINFIPIFRTHIHENSFVKGVFDSGRCKRRRRLQRRKIESRATPTAAMSAQT